MLSFHPTFRSMFFNASVHGPPDSVPAMLDGPSDQVSAPPLSSGAPSLSIVNHEEWVASSLSSFDPASLMDDEAIPAGIANDPVAVNQHMLNKLMKRIDSLSQHVLVCLFKNLRFSLHHFLLLY